MAWVRSILQQRGSLLSRMTGMETRDFSDMYPSVPQADLILQLDQMIDATFKHKEDEDGSTALLIPGYKKLDRDPVKWCKPQDDDHEERIGIAINRDDLKQWVRFVIQNTRCELGGEVFHLVHGIPIGAN